MGQNEFNILIVDDERSNLDILCRILRDEGDNVQNYSLSVAKSGLEALKRIEENKPDLILLDIVMPGMSGFDVLSALNESYSARSIPVIVITALNSVDDEEKSFHMGAVDFITKPFHKSLVKARIQTHLRMVEQMRIIEQLVLFDSLTGIANRRSFDNRMEIAWARSVREKIPLSFLMADVDNFKKFNDTYGHQQGDAALKTIAALIKSSVKRPTDIAARWGGEEFAVLLAGTELSGAMKVAENIRTRIAETVIKSIQDASELSITVSIGVVSMIASAENSITNFIEQADKALYTAKKSGRNRVCS